VVPARLPPGIPAAPISRPKQRGIGRGSGYGSANASKRRSSGDSMCEVQMQLILTPNRQQGDLHDRFILVREPSGTGSVSDIHRNGHAFRSNRNSKFRLLFTFTPECRLSFLRIPCSLPPDPVDCPDSRMSLNAALPKVAPRKSNHYDSVTLVTCRS
jgi:hypothetical protein